MNEQLKKRLVGAVVLVALAAIFIPMLFNGGEETEMPTFGSNVPDRPAQEVQTIEVPLQVPPPQEVDSRPVESQQQADAYEAQPPASQNEAAPAPVAAVPAPEPAPAPLPATAAEVKPAPAAPSKPAATRPAPAGKPAATTRPASGWAVQLGSFGKAANALALRDKLRNKGHSAFVEQLKGPSGTVYRVRVGPEVKRENADALKAKLEKVGFKGVVMPHP